MSNCCQRKTTSPLKIDRNVGHQKDISLTRNMKLETRLDINLD